MKRVLMAFLMSAVGLSTAATAQQPPAPGEAGPGSTAPGAAEAARFDQAEKLTPRQMVDRSERSLDDMRQVLKDVLKILEEARAEKDVVKLNCVNEALTQIKGLVRVSEQSSISLQEAVAKQELYEARHEFTKIAVARDKITDLRVRAEECVGQLAFVVDQETQVEVEVPADIPDVDTGIEPIPPVTVRPPPASPTG